MITNILILITGIALYFIGGIQLINTLQRHWSVPLAYWLVNVIGIIGVFVAVVRILWGA